MGYYVFKSGKTWVLQWQQGKKDHRHINKKSEEAQMMGFRPELTYEQAKTRAKQLQAEEWVKEEAKKRARSKEITEKYRQLRSAFLTNEDAEEFEQKYLLEHKIQTSHWNTMQKIIIGVEIHPSEWFDQKNKLYAEFRKLNCSANYAKKLLRYLNIWGYFLCKKQNRAWMKVPGLDGAWRNKLEDKRRPGGPSKPLSPAQLEDKKKEMKEEHYKWLYLSVWFGLRPEEVDSLKAARGEFWDLQKNSELGWVLHVFQTKLFKRGVPKDDCWKFIPAVFPEQNRAIEYILEGRFARPTGEGGKFMRKLFGEGYTHYAGRNNFSGMLRDCGYDPETRRHWMGHLSVTTTERYDRKTQRGKVFYRAAASHK